MPTVEKTIGGRVFIRPLEQEFRIGDRVDVDAEMAAYLCEERGDFERVDDGASTGEPEGSTSETDELDTSDDFSANGWLDNDYQERADAVRAGGLDEYLGEIVEAETSQTVIDAVEERRAELED